MQGFNIPHSPGSSVNGAVFQGPGHSLPLQGELLFKAKKRERIAQNKIIKLVECFSKESSSGKFFAFAEVFTKVRNNSRTPVFQIHLHCCNADDDIFK